jgi:hypothetical protein
MTVVDPVDILDGAKLVRTTDSPHPLIAVWHGGTTVNIYTTDPNGWHETTCFNLSDEKGRPVDRDTMDEHISDWFDRELNDD